MTQSEYNTIVECIKYGAPAQATRLINALNTVLMCKDDEDKIEDKEDK